jgi:16S rRNA (guanine527-N7)-methyltransferase
MTPPLAVNDRPVRTALGATGFARLTDVSRETLDRLGAYAALLTSWNRRINLVGRDTIGDLWRRHILDSAQLFPLIPPAAGVLVDLGSGAGLPGLVLAIMGVPEVHLVEADQRKAAFLREAVRITGAGAEVHARRAETMPRLEGDVVTARALAPLPALVDMATPFLGRHGIGLFLKGRGVEAELAGIDETSGIRWERLPSRSDPSGSVIRVESIHRAPRRGFG